MTDNLNIEIYLIDKDDNILYPSIHFDNLHYDPITDELEIENNITNNTITINEVDFVCNGVVVSLEISGDIQIKPNGSSTIEFEDHEKEQITQLVDYCRSLLVVQFQNISTGLDNITNIYNERLKIE